MIKKWRLEGEYVIISGDGVNHVIPFSVFTDPRGLMLLPAADNKCHLNPYRVPVRGFGGTDNSIIPSLMRKPRRWWMLSSIRYTVIPG